VKEEAMSEPRNGNVAIRRKKGECPGHDPRLARAARDLLDALAARDQGAIARARRALREVLDARGY
jgi:hypothetical protein